MVLGSLLFLVAYQSARKPLIELQASPTSEDLPPAVKTKVVQVLSLLPSGTARSLLSDVVYLGQDLRKTFAQTKSIPSDVERYAGELLIAACNSALVLERLDRTLVRLEIQRLEFSELPAEWLEGLNKCEQTRDCLVQRLLETVAMLGIAQSQAVLAPRGVGQQLAEINTELRRELHIQAAVTREFEKLFDPLPLKA
jgi:hypothetical protein